MFAWAGEALLARLAPWRHAPAWRVAFSGGLDSTVLLHALAGLRERHDLPPLTALHIHHGLQTVADAWVAHAEQQCAALGVPLTVQRVQVASGASVEAQAREARYQVFTAQLAAGELLLLAQHADDQAETLLFRLLRGAGVRGLAAMPAQRPVGQGTLFRPLLAVPRAELERYARHHQLSWIDDPSNQDTQLDRNFLRLNVLPLLRERWPQLHSNVLRTAEYAAESDQLLAELAELDLQLAQLELPAHLAALNLPALALDALKALSPQRQRNVLRHWLRERSAMPDSRHWQGWQDLLMAGDDAEPVWRWQTGSVRRSRMAIWWLPQRLENPPEAQALAAHADWQTLPGNGQCRVQGSLPAQPLSVRYRQGGEVLRLAGRGSRDLKRYLQEQQIPAFLRGRWPLLYAGEQLLCVANLAPATDEGVSLLWQPDF
ncbi:tRNA(Ile)-lysidine synthase [Atopomonas hussainii]|uniref:tRNA(Ile)-lysidine synthase n=1 Tax=Atopomonas hussainii TaxID=1429083 RepID=A0A1H7IUZ0_9GAMM|nr:tRNA lysidine(34) synthetase TilS [Atopomonas hussainii]SEK65527.1 tRNA(Ile)-lysidine synthase [Atopomonas hussainii]